MRLIDGDALIDSLGISDRDIYCKYLIEEAPTIEPERKNGEWIPMTEEPMSLRKEQCNKVCKILDDVLANRPTERDSLIVAVRKAFDALDTNGWIPCWERLPEEEEEVLVTRSFLGCKDGSGGHIPPKTYVEVAERIGDSWTALSDEYKIARSRHTDPIAWMPLPEPYKGDKS